MLPAGTCYRQRLTRPTSTKLLTRRGSFSQNERYPGPKREPMSISMQGNWTISVKSISASFPQRFVVTGADTGNGAHDASTSMSDVNVTGSQWSLSVLNNPGDGFRLSNTRLKSPTLAGDGYSFDIESNDAGGDQDFNDLILTCSTPAMADDYLIYGNVTLYSGRCIFNPCYRNWLVIDHYDQLVRALDIPGIREIIEKYYPERVPPLKVNPNPPDPPPYFTPMMINLTEEVQIPAPRANIFQQTGKVSASPDRKKNAPDAREQTTEMALSNFTFREQLSLSQDALQQKPLMATSVSDRVSLAKIADHIRLFCSTEPGVNLTLNFEEYDRTTSELAGGAYTGTGNRLPLGSAITDMNGNYIFRFKQSFSEWVNEILHDVKSGENIFAQMLPDLIIKIKDTFHPSITLFESAPKFNVPHLKRIDFCLPASKVPSTSSLCFNGNLLGSLGNVFIGGDQNITGSLAPVALDRAGYNNHLRDNGIISVHNTMAGFQADCACWVGAVDVKGCLFNLQRKNTDPVIRFYTVRFKKPGDDWQFVTETYLHPRFSKRNIPNYNGDMTGPFPTSLHVDGGPAMDAPAYINIQAKTYFDGEDWEFTNLDRYLQLHTTLYENGTPGTVYFRIDGYDQQGNPVPLATDLVALFIDNRNLNFGLGNIAFTSPVEFVACGLYKMTEAQMNTPLDIQFKASDEWGFVDNYRLSIGKCPNPISIEVLSPASLAGTVTNGILADGSKPGNTDAATPACPGYYGTLEDFATPGFVDMIIQPAASEGGWMSSSEQYVVISGGLTAVKRQTNGYNTGNSGIYHQTFSFAIERKS